MSAKELDKDDQDAGDRAATHHSHLFCATCHRGTPHRLIGIPPHVSAGEPDAGRQDWECTVCHRMWIDPRHIGEERV